MSLSYVCSKYQTAQRSTKPDNIELNIFSRIDVRLTARAQHAYKFWIINIQKCFMRLQLTLAKDHLLWSGNVAVCRTGRQQCVHVIIFDGCNLLISHELRLKDAFFTTQNYVLILTYKSKRREEKKNWKVAMLLSRVCKIFSLLKIFVVYGRLL